MTRLLWDALGDVPDRRGRQGRQYELRSVWGSPWLRCWRRKPAPGRFQADNIASARTRAPARRRRTLARSDSPSLMCGMKVIATRSPRTTAPMLAQTASLRHGIGGTSTLRGAVERPARPNTGHDIPVALELDERIASASRALRHDAWIDLVFTVDEQRRGHVEPARWRVSTWSVFRRCAVGVLDAPDAIRRIPGRDRRRQPVSRAPRLCRRRGAFCTILARHDMSRRIDAALARLVARTVCHSMRPSRPLSTS